LFSKKISSFVKSIRILYFFVIITPILLAMKEFLIQIPEQKEALLKELLFELGCTFIESAQDNIPNEHKELVLHLIQTENDQAFIPWNEVKTMFKK